MIAIRDAVDSQFQTVRAEGKTWRVFAARGAESDVRVFVGEELESRSSILRAVLRFMFWPMLVALPLSRWRVVGHLQRYGSSAQAQSHVGHSRSARPGPGGSCPRAFRNDAAAGRAEQPLRAYWRLAGFRAPLHCGCGPRVADPIAAIQIQAQVALAESNDALRRHALQAVVEGCERATHVVDQLLTLSRLEADATASKQVIDLGGIVRRVIADLAPKAIGKRQALELQETSGCTVAGDETLLAVLARNLVDNAVRYSPTSARVEVRLEHNGRQVKLTVEDSGPGLSEPDLGRLGERFFRAPGNDESGTGLGWSIARRIADVHGAQLCARRSAALGGLAVEVLFAS